VDNLNSLVLIAKVDRTHDLFERQVTAVAKTFALRRWKVRSSRILDSVSAK
jgi:hypothetical protein